MSESTLHSVQPVFDATAVCYRYQHDAESPVPPSTAVVLAVGSITDERPRAMPVLRETIAPETIDTLVSDTGTTGTLSFEYHGHSVTVDASGNLRLVPLQRNVFV